LIRVGFLEFVFSGASSLFPELKHQQITGWFARLRSAIGIESVDEFGNRKVFHSLRHTLITKARAAGVPVEKVQQVVGHEKVSSGIIDRYTHRFPLDDVLEVVDAIVY
jgi:integrase